MRKLRSRPSILALISLVWLTSLPSRAQDQSSATAPQFDVTSVKPNNSDTTESDLNHDLPDRFVASNVPLGFLILDAYGIRAHELIGAPGWIWDKSYDVIGTFSTPNPPLHNVHLMEQQMLSERFDLRLHTEMRVVPAYDLVFAREDGRLGPQLHESTMDCVAWAANRHPEVASTPRSGAPPARKRPACNILATRTWLSGGARSIQELANSLQSMLGRPVVDKTGLPGRYDMDLQWAGTDLRVGDDPLSPSADAPPIFDAVKEQLGLKLVPHKEPFNVFIVDHIQALTQN